MKKFVYFFFLSTILLLSSCTSSIPNDEQPIIPEELPYNQQVFYQIFPAIFDSMEVINQLTITPVPPPPPSLEYYKDSNEYKKRLSEYQEIIEEIAIDTTIHIIAICDTARYSIDEAKYYGSTKLDSLQKSFRIDLEELSIHSDTFRLKYLSEVTKDNSFELKSEYKKRIRYRLHLSNVYLDGDKLYGFLKWSKACGRLCGEGGRIFIQNINGKWIIVRITHEWVS